MAELFELFPHLKSETLIIRKMTEDDVAALSEITENPNVYRYVPPFLYKKSRGNLLAAIRNLAGRDFEKKRMICAGIYLSADPEKLIGLVEMFDYKPRKSQITVGYKINESYWHKGIASETIRLITNYLCIDAGVNSLKAYVMPENVFSLMALKKNGFIEEQETVQGRNWGGHDICELIELTYTSH